MADKVAEIESTGGDFSEVHELVSGGNQYKAWTSGDIDAGMVTVGMSGGLINDIPTCKELVRTIVADAERVIGNRLVSIVAEGAVEAATAAGFRRPAGVGEREPKN